MVPGVAGLAAAGFGAGGVLLITALSLAGVGISARRLPIDGHQRKQGK